jgi:Spy/CpxP family protein refolding chaperone
VSIQQIRKSVLIAVGLAALGIAGLLAGRISAGAMPGQGHRDSAMRMFRHMSEALGLTDDQKTQIKGILKTHAAEIEGHMKALSDARKALHQATLSDAPDESAIRSAAQSLGAVQGDGALLFVKIRAEVVPILNDNQRGKLQQFRERAKGRGDSSIKSFEAFLESKS